MPEPKSPCTIGTSVRVAKYMNAPARAAKKLANRPFPPTNPAIQRDGMMPLSVPGMPRRNPATSTPPSKRGAIIRVYIQVESIQLFISSDDRMVVTMRPAIPAPNARSGHFGKSSASMSTTTPVMTIGAALAPNHFTRL